MLFRSNQTRLAALGQVAGTLQSQAGLSNQMVSNIVTANGINTQAAQNLFAAGSITQAQLSAILQAASAYNGYSYTQDSTSRSDESTDSSSWGISPDLIGSLAKLPK